MPKPTASPPTANALAKPGHTELKVAAAALAAVASPPLGVAVAAGAVLSSRDVREAVRRGTVKTVAAAIQAGEQVTAAVARRATPGNSEPVPSDPKA